MAVLFPGAFSNFSSFGRITALAVGIVRVFLVEVLMIFFGRIKRLQRIDLSDDRIFEVRLRCSFELSAAAFSASFS